MTRTKWLTFGVALVAALATGYCARAYQTRPIPVAAQGPYLGQPGAQEVAYRHARVEFFRQSKATADLVMLGDSITEGGDWAELLPGMKVLNRGIRWDTTDDILARLDEVIARQPKVVFLMIGINDIRQGRPLDAIAKNMGDIVARLQAAKVHCVIGSTLFLSPAYQREDTNARVKAFNEKLRALAAAANIEVMDLNAALAPEGSLNPALTFDGIHLNAAGYLRWRDQLQQRIR